ncbi:DUF6542 domain-containing protein [Streptosporangium sp. NPDC020145]|uniref:DUF6542 domain-containing protein n=1 Tax=Streptosporangium sp. NPDC020145 TaxID=3154694 RepID=UPI003438224E
MNERGDGQPLDEAARVGGADRPGGTGQSNGAGRTGGAAGRTGGTGRKDERGRPGGGVRLTARGAIALVLVSTLAGRVLQAVVGPSALLGLTFVAGCAGAVVLVNRRDLLSLVVSPPLVFFVAALVTEAVSAMGAKVPVQAFGLGMFALLSASAPWLFAGSLLVLLVAWRRGLATCVRELREELRAAGPAPARQKATGAAFAPEPEGYFEPKVYGTPREEQPTEERPAQEQAADGR